MIPVPPTPVVAISEAATFGFSGKRHICVSESLTSVGRGTCWFHPVMPIIMGCAAIPFDETYIYVSSQITATPGANFSKGRARVPQSALVAVVAADDGAAPKEN